MLLITGIVFSTLILSLIAFPFPASAQKGPNFIPGSEVVGVFGKIPGQDLIVHILVVLSPGAEKNEVVREALAGQGARPWVHDEFSTTGLVWDQFSDDNSVNDFVTQHYNPEKEPNADGGNRIGAEAILRNTLSTWTNVATSTFAFDYGGQTDRCPSLVRECPGRQNFDGFNDVAWLDLSGCCTLGVTWFSTSIDEADMALNKKFPWSTDGVNDFDVETVFLHENGHVAGLGHSDIPGAVMEPSYQEVRRALHQDDKDGIAWLYPAVSNDFPIISILSPADGSTFDSGATILFEGTASDTEDGDLTASLVWTSDKDGQIGTGGSFSATLSDGDHVITASVTDGNGATGTASVSITVGTVNSVPTVSITSPADGSTFDSGTTILFEGSASDTEDGDLTASLVWTSDKDGQIGTGGSFSATLSDGDHVITATVTDSGSMSGSASVSVMVQAPTTGTSTIMHVHDISFNTEIKGKSGSANLYIFVTIQDSNHAGGVEGATVQLKLTGTDGINASGSGTTNSNGVITFKYKDATVGETYTAEVINVSKDGSTYDSTLNDETKDSVKI